MKIFQSFWVQHVKKTAEKVNVAILEAQNQCITFWVGSLICTWVFSWTSCTSGLGLFCVEDSTSGQSFSSELKGHRELVEWTPCPIFSHLSLLRGLCVKDPMWCSPYWNTLFGWIWTATTGSTTLATPYCVTTWISLCNSHNKQLPCSKTSFPSSTPFFSLCCCDLCRFPSLDA